MLSTRHLNPLPLTSPGPHQHSGVELLYLISGELDLTIGSETFNLESGTPCTLIRGCVTAITVLAEVRALASLLPHEKPQSLRNRKAAILPALFLLVSLVNPRYRRKENKKMLAYEALPLLTAKWAKNSDSHRQCIMQRAPRLKKRPKVGNLHGRTFRFEPQVCVDGPLCRSNQVKYLLI